MINAADYEQRAVGAQSDWICLVGVRNVVQVSRAASDAALNGHRDRAEQLPPLKGVGSGSGNNQHL